MISTVLRQGPNPVVASSDLEMPKSSTLTSGVPSRRREKQVRRLEIAVDDAERVRLGERVARLQDVLGGLLDGGSGPRAASAPARSVPSRYSMTM